MSAYFLFLLFPLLNFSDLANDPVNEAWQGKDAARAFECERFSQAEAHKRWPGRIPATHARASTMFGIDALVCDRRIVPDGLRSPRDELILRSLNDEVLEVSALVESVDVQPKQWVVEAFYPDLPMVRKIASAQRVALAERGLPVSDMPPLLTAGDVEVFLTLPMRRAIPLACKRLYATSSLDDDTAFLAVALLHEKESQLHAGTCIKGKFTWLR